jgi:elongation factor Ts
MAEIKAAQVKELRERTGVGMMDAKRALVEVDGDMDKAIDLLREKGMAKAAKKGDRIAAEGLTSIAVDGNVAVLVELNSETDFVAKNDMFQGLVKDLAEAIAANKPASNEEVLAMAHPEHETFEKAILNATTVIGEKISFRRFALLEKTDADVFGTYNHGGRIGVITLLAGTSDEGLAKGVAMHVASMNPQFVSRDQVPAEVIAHEKSIILAADDMKSKPENIQEKMAEGRLNKYLAEICLVDQEYVITGDKQTVGAVVAAAGATVSNFARFEVGEGIEKREDDFAAEVAAQMAAAK